MLFLDRERAFVYSWMLVAGYAVAWIVLLLSSKGLVDPNGIPVGGDYVLYYATSRVLHERPAQDVYDIGVLNGYQSAAVDKDMGRKLPMIYPPPYFFLVYPLGSMPYPVSLVVFLAATSAMLYGTLRLVGAEDFPLPLLMFAFPAVFIALINGQNGLLTGALLGGGLLLAGRRDVLSGVLVGLAFYKPHLAFPALVALAAGGRVVGVASCLATVAGLCIGSLAVFGAGAWRSFFEIARLAQRLMSGDTFPLAKMMSTFAALRLLGVPDAPALAVQAAVSAAALGAIILAWRATRDRNLRVAVTTACILLFPHYSFSYDWVVLLVGFLCLFRHARERGLEFSTSDKIAIGSAYIAPLFSSVLSVKAGVQVAPLTLGALLWCLLRLMNRERLAGSSTNPVS